MNLDRAGWLESTEGSKLQRDKKGTPSGKPVEHATNKLMERAEESDIKGGHVKGHRQGRSAFIVNVIQIEI